MALPGAFISLVEAPAPDLDTTSTDKTTSLTKTVDARDEKASLFHPALTAKFEKINLSFTYAGITIYRKYEDNSDTNNDPKMDTASNACSRYLETLNGTPKAPESAHAASHATIVSLRQSCVTLASIN